MSAGKTQFLATEAEARAAICSVVAELAADGLAAAELGNVEIVLAEVVNNIVEHAYRDTGPGRVFVAYELTGCGLNLAVSDDGLAFPEDQLPPGDPPNLDVPRDQMPEGGFGWHLIRTLTSGLRYERQKNGNKLDLRFEFGKTRH